MGWLSIDRQSIKADPSSEVFIAIGRIFSGVLNRESNLYVLGHRHDPLDDNFVRNGNPDFGMLYVDLYDANLFYS